MFSSQLCFHPFYRFIRTSKKFLQINFYPLCNQNCIVSANYFKQILSVIDNRHPSMTTYIYRHHCCCNIIITDMFWINSLNRLRPDCVFMHPHDMLASTIQINKLGKYSTQIHGIVATFWPIGLFVYVCTSWNNRSFFGEQQEHCKKSLEWYNWLRPNPVPQWVWWYLIAHEIHVTVCVRTLHCPLHWTIV